MNIMRQHRLQETSCRVQTILADLDESQPRFEPGSQEARDWAYVVQHLSLARARLITMERRQS